MIRKPMHRLVALGALGASFALAGNARGQVPTTPELTVSRIAYEGPTRAGSGTATFRITVWNAEGRAATPADEAVLVTVILVDPTGRRSTHEARITTSIAPNSSQMGVLTLTSITMREGTYAITAFASLPATPTRAVIRSPNKQDKIIIAAP